MSCTILCYLSESVCFSTDAYSLYSYFKCKAIMKYFTAFEDKITVTCCLFVPKMPLSEPPDSNNGCKK